MFRVLSFQICIHFIFCCRICRFLIKSADFRKICRFFALKESFLNTFSESGVQSCAARWTAPKTWRPCPGLGCFEILNNGSMREQSSSAYRGFRKSAEICRFLEICRNLQIFYKSADFCSEALTFEHEWWIGRGKLCSGTSSSENFKTLPRAWLLRNIK